MGLLLSVLLTYAGGAEAARCVRYILAGLLPDTDPDFEELVQHYTRLLQRAAHTNPPDWTQHNGNGYLALADAEDGKLASASIKYYGGRNDSTALLFSTKISSFGQESIDSISADRDAEYGNKRTPERYTSTTTTIIPQTIKSFSVGSRNRSPTGSCENISDRPHSLGNSFERREEEEDKTETKEKLTWHYRPLSPVPQTTLPEIHFQSFEHNPPGAEDHDPDSPYSEDFLRSLDGVKFRPLQRADPSGRRRSFKKRNSSSSTSSRGSSKASREEELRVFTSLEEAEFGSFIRDKPDYGSAPNLTTRSHSRSRSRENSKETKANANESWSAEALVDSTNDAENSAQPKPRLKDLPQLGSFEEEKPSEDATQKDTTEVNDEEVDEDLDDFWGNSDD